MGRWEGREAERVEEAMWGGSLKGRDMVWEMGKKVEHDAAEDRVGGTK